MTIIIKMAAEDAHLLELYISCGESLMQRGDRVQAQDLLTAGVYLALSLGDPRSISRCQQNLLRINAKHPAALPDFDRNVKIQAQAAKIQQKYTPLKMQTLRQTLDELEAADRAQRSMVSGAGAARPSAPGPIRPVAPPPPPSGVPPTPIMDVPLARPGPASRPPATSKPAAPPTASPPVSPTASAPAPPSSRPTPPVAPPSTPPEPPSDALPAFAQKPKALSSHEINPQDGSTVRIRPSKSSAKLAHRPFYLAILSDEMQWEPLCPVGPAGVEIGREQPGQPFADLPTLAPRHARIRPNEQGQIIVEDLGSTGGVFHRIKQPERLSDGLWLRIGSQLLEFRMLKQIPPAELPGNEQLWTPAPVTAWGELVVLRADREPTARYALVPAEVIVGREASRGADLVLYGDRNASSRHARIRRTDAGAEIEDLGSLNGTYIRREGSFIVGPEDVLMMGEVMLKILDRG